jgi:hypothetical protein
MFGYKNITVQSRYVLVSELGNGRLQLVLVGGGKRLLTLVAVGFCAACSSSLSSKHHRRTASRDAPPLNELVGVGDGLADVCSVVTNASSPTSLASAPLEVRSSGETLLLVPVGARPPRRMVGSARPPPDVLDSARPLPTCSTARGLP